MALTHFHKRLLSLVSGAAAAQFITLASLPVITRIYSPEDVGILGAAVAAVTIATNVGCLRYEQAIPLAATRRGAIGLVWLSLTLIAITLLIAWPALEVCSYLVPSLARALPSVGLVAGGFGVSAVSNVLLLWMTREDLVHGIAASRVLTALGQAALKIGAGLFVATEAMLLIGHFGGIVFSLVIIVGLLWRRNALPTPKMESVSRDIYHAAKRHHKFFKFGLAEGAFTTIGNQAPVLLFAALIGTSEAALLALGTQVMRGPVTLISNAIGRLFLADVIKAKKKGHTKEMVEGHLLVQTKVGIPVVIALGFAGSTLAPFVFGAEFAAVSRYFLWMIPWMSLVMLVSPFVPALYDAGKFKAALALALSGAILRIGAVVLAASLVVDPIAILACAAITSYLLYLAVLVRLPEYSYNYLNALRRGSVVIGAVLICGLLVWVAAQSDWVRPVAGKF